jgi:hypothetical protein
MQERAKQILFSFVSFEVVLIAELCLEIWSPRLPSSTSILHPFLCGLQPDVMQSVLCFPQGHHGR